MDQSFLRGASRYFQLTVLLRCTCVPQSSRHEARERTTAIRLSRISCYQITFIPNWIWRELVAVEAITPALELSQELLASLRKLGAAKFG